LLFVVLLLHILPVVLFLLPRPAPRPTLFPYTTLFRSEDLDLLLQEFLGRIETARSEYLDAGEEGSADERLEKLVYGRFLEPGPRKAFFEAYKEIESLWEILSPSPELRDHVSTYKRLAQ